MSDEPIKQEEGLIVRGEQELASVVLFSKKFDALMGVSAKFLKSGMLPTAYKQPEQVAMVILKGRELGVSEFAALQGMYPVGANIGYTVQFILSMIRKHKDFQGFDYKFNPDEINPVSCTVTMKRVSFGDLEIKSWTFSIEDAKRAGLIKPDSNYVKWMKNMLLSRAVANCSRVMWSDIFSAPAYLTEELNPDMAIDVDIEDIKYEKDSGLSYKNAYDALQKAKKTNKIEDLQSWYELYSEDVKNLPENLRKVIIKEFQVAEIRLKPQVNNAKPDNKVSTETVTENKSITA
jgi:hypothetical protein